MCQTTRACCSEPADGLFVNVNVLLMVNMQFKTKAVTNDSTFIEQCTIWSIELNWHATYMCKAQVCSLMCLNIVFWRVVFLCLLSNPTNGNTRCYWQSTKHMISFLYNNITQDWRWPPVALEQKWWDYNTDWTERHGKPCTADRWLFIMKCSQCRWSKLIMLTLYSISR